MVEKFSIKIESEGRYEQHARESFYIRLKTGAAHTLFMKYIIILNQSKHAP